MENLQIYLLQVLTQRLEQATKSKIYLIKKLDKAKEDIDDLRFQVKSLTESTVPTKCKLLPIFVDLA